MLKTKVLTLIFVNGLFISLIALLWFSGQQPDKGGPTQSNRAPISNNPQPVVNGILNGYSENDTVSGPVLSQLVTPTLSPVVADLSPAVESVEAFLDREINPRFSLDQAPSTPDYSIIPDPLLDHGRAPQAISSFNTPSLNFDGLGYSYINPPDVVGEIGPDHYIQMANMGGGTQVNIYNKQGTLLQPSFALDALGTGDCNNGLGDPIPLYDEAADRWLISEFSISNNNLCVYVSQTADPQGAWYAYQFTTPNFPDYPKYAVWHDAYYVGVNESTPSVLALERDKMLLGQSAQMIRQTITPVWNSFDAMLPADIDGPLEPSSDTPGLFMRQVDDDYLLSNPDPTNDFLELWAFTADFDTPANSTFTLLESIPVAEFSSYFCNAGFYCVTQQGTTRKLDNVREPLMWRVQYRRFPEHETIVGNYVVNGDGNGQTAIRWFELRSVAGGDWELHQEGTFAPNGHNYWMGSAAMDKSGNIALGYSIASSTLYPGLGYTGRLQTDTHGQMSYGANTLISGSSFSSSGRWGDYQSLNVDPADGCTFWFTGEYMSASSWNTRIASFRFPSCGELLGSAVISPSIAGGQLGQTLTYTVTLTSTSSLTQTWDLSPTAAWPVVLDPQEVELSPLGSAMAIVTATIPATLTTPISESLQIDIVDPFGITGTVTATMVAEEQLPVIPLTVTTNAGLTPTLYLDWTASPTCTTDLYHSQDVMVGYALMSQNITSIYNITPGASADRGFYFIQVDCDNSAAISQKFGYIRFDLSVSP